MKQRKSIPAKKRLSNRRLWRELRKAVAESFRRHRRLLAISYAFNLLYIGTTVVLPLPLKFIIDAITEKGDVPGWMQRLSGVLTLPQVVLCLSAVVIAITLVRSAAIRFHKLSIARVREQVSLELRDRLLRHILTLPPTMYTTYRTGELVHRLMNDVDLFTRLQSKTLPAVFQHVLTGLFILAIMFWMAPLLGFVSLLLVPGLVGLMKFYGPGLQTTTRNKRKFEGEVAGLAQEALRGVPTIQALGGEAYTRKRFAELNALSLRAGVANIRAATKMERIMQAAEGIALALITGGGALFVLHGQITVGSLTVFATYIKKLLTPIEKINDLSSDLARGLAAGEQIFALLRHRPLVQDGPHVQKLTGVKGYIFIRDLCFSYPDAPPDQPPVLQHVNMALQPGELAVLAGASGSGKSTLLSLLLRLYEPAAGGISLDGVPISQFTLQSFRRQVAVMLQNTHLFAGSMREALNGHGMPFPDQKLWEALAFVGMETFVGNLPGGLDAVLGEDAMNLSGGQRKRISLARAFLMDRPILLLDEPLANVDVESAAVILQALEVFRRNKTCLAITHQPALMQMADRLYLIEHGCVREVAREKTVPEPPDGRVLHVEPTGGMWP